MLSLECVSEQMEESSSACSDRTPEDPLHCGNIMLLGGEVLSVSVRGGARERKEKWKEVA